MNMSRTRSVLRFAKKKLLECQGILKRTGNDKVPASSNIMLDEPVLEEILRKLDIKDRVMLRGVSPQILQLVDRLPLILPFVFIRSDSRGNIELHCDHMDVLIGRMYKNARYLRNVRKFGIRIEVEKYLLRFSHYETKGKCYRLDYILVDVPGFKVHDGVMVFNYSDTRMIIVSIVSRITGIVHLWLDSTWNGHIVQAIVEYYQAINHDNKRKRFHLEQLTIIGSIRFSDIDWVSSLILLSRRSLSHLRFRHCRVHSQQQTVQLWTAVMQCQSLSALQYEPCRLDRWSRPHLVDALTNKPLKSLILTGIDGLQPKDLFRMTNGARLEELAVVGELITPSIFDHKEASALLGTVNSLLIQVNSTFSIHDASERSAILRMMSSLPATGVLEVIHISRGTVTDTTKVISYWIQLARDSSREVKLKLEECSQERADAAVGRLLRKVRGVGRSEWAKGGVAMQMGDGRLTVLDKKAWFGDDQ
uniref:F-box domain-containing protein n=1 Tax=Angiostrongylus cantonensis TaxID=6313 RepID=A0A158PBL3_ANGCA